MKRSKQYYAACRVIDAIREAGGNAVFAGGCVRDMLLERPVKDIDIATDLLPDAVQALFPKTIAVGAQFGVVVVVEGKLQFEVATFRTDGSYSDGRRPDEITYSNIEEDAKRRDFTINALFYDPRTDQVMDFVNGREDLEKQIIRAVGDPVQRINEDALRMLRACRFAGALGFEIETATQKAITENATRISQVSAERIHDELDKMLCGNAPRACLEQLDECMLLEQILPEVHALKGVEQPPEYHPEGDVWEHTLIMMDMLDETPEKELAFGALFHDIGKPLTKTVEDRIRFNNHDRVGAEMTASICERLRFSNKETDALVCLVRTHQHFINVQQMRKGKLKRFLWQEHFPLMLKLHRIDCQASHGMLDNYYFCQQKLEDFAHEKEVFAPILRGTDLLMAGFSPGPMIGEILRRIQEEQLNENIKTHEEALAFAQVNYPIT